VARAVNTELVMLYWSIGRDILDQQQVGGWGDDVVGRIAQDLSADTDSAHGFSRRNLFYMRRFATLWPEREKVQPLAAQIGWTHHQVLIDAFGDSPDLYAWYAAKASENRWSRRYIKGQIDLRLHERQGTALTNFSRALEPADADRMLQAIKDPYVFDFLELAEDAPGAPTRTGPDRRYPEFPNRARHGIRVLWPAALIAGRRSGVLPGPDLLPPHPAPLGSIMSLRSGVMKRGA